jgi:cyclomaltodextrinase
LFTAGRKPEMKKTLRFFDKDTVEWKESDFRETYTKLNNLKRVNKALWNGNFGGEMAMINSDKEKSVFAFTREKEGNKVAAIFNLSPDEQEFNLESASLEGNYKDLFSGKPVSLKNKESMKLKAWGYLVYYK